MKATEYHIQNYTQASKATAKTYIESFHYENEKKINMKYDTYECIWGLG